MQGFENLLQENTTKPVMNGAFGSLHAKNSKSSLSNMINHASYQVSPVCLVTLFI